MWQLVAGARSCRALAEPPAQASPPTPPSSSATTCPARLPACDTWPARCTTLQTWCSLQPTHSPVDPAALQCCGAGPNPAFRSRACRRPGHGAPVAACCATPVGCWPVLPMHAQAFQLEVQELQLQAWGTTAAEMYSCGAPPAADPTAGCASCPACCRCRAGLPLRVRAGRLPCDAYCMLTSPVGLLLLQAWT